MRENKPREEKHDHLIRQIWLPIFDLILGTIKLAWGVAFVLLIYGLFGDAMKSMWQPTPIPIASSATKPSNPPNAEEQDEIVNGVHLLSGLKVDTHWELVRGTCTACHSAKMITQSRATREGWEQMIRWMQATQGLWDLGTNEPLILDYLAANYAPEETGRRANLEIEAIEWYILELPEDE